MLIKTENTFRQFMQAQRLAIIKYKIYQLNQNRFLSDNEAAFEWIEKYSSDFRKQWEAFNLKKGYL